MRLLTINKVQSRKKFVRRLLESGSFPKTDEEALMNMDVDVLAGLLIRNTWSPEAREAAAKARHSKFHQVLLSHGYKKVGGAKGPDKTSHDYQRTHKNGRREVIHISMGHRSGVNQGKTSWSHHQRTGFGQGHKVAKGTTHGELNDHLMSYHRKPLSNVWSPEAREAAKRARKNAKKIPKIYRSMIAKELWGPKTRMGQMGTTQNPLTRGRSRVETEKLHEFKVRAMVKRLGKSYE